MSALTSATPTADFHELDGEAVRRRRRRLSEAGRSGAARGVRPAGHHGERAQRARLAGLARRLRTWRAAGWSISRSTQSRSRPISWSRAATRTWCGSCRRPTRSCRSRTTGGGPIVPRRGACRLRWRHALERGGAEPVSRSGILAHSMGGLVVRAMIASPRGRKTWERLCANPGGRVVMLGTPNGGSHAIAAMLMGRDALVRKLALLDLRHGYAELLRVIARFPGVLELLPDDGSLDLFDPKSWSRLFKHDVPAAASRRVLVVERRLREVGGLRLDEAGAGAPGETRARCATCVRRQPDRSGAHGLRGGVCAGDGRRRRDRRRRGGGPARTRDGDLAGGRSGLLEDRHPAALAASRTYYMDAAHGDLREYGGALPGAARSARDGRDEPPVADAAGFARSSGRRLRAAHAGAGLRARPRRSDGDGDGGTLAQSACRRSAAGARPDGPREPVARRVARGGGALRAGPAGERGAASRRAARRPPERAAPHGAVRRAARHGDRGAERADRSGGHPSRGGRRGAGGDRRAHPRRARADPERGAHDVRRRAFRSGAAAPPARGRRRDGSDGRRARHHRADRVG